MKKKHRLLTILCYAICIVFAFVFLFPLFWSLLTSFKSYKEAFAWPPIFFPAIRLANYRSYLSQNSFLLYLRNSLIVTLVSSSVSMVVGVLAAYSLARGRVRGGNGIAMFMLASRFVPPVATIIPLYMVYRKIGLYDTLLGLILLHIAMNVPYVVWMMRGFFRDIPIAIEEAAWIEGCGKLEGLVKIVLPMSKSGLAATAVLTMIFSWNDFLYSMSLTGAKAKTLPLSMGIYMNETGIEWQMMATCAVMIMLPALIFSILVHRNLGAGLSFGAVKE